MRDLRRTYISLSRSIGIAPKVIQANARHSSITMTMDTYAKAYTEDQRDGNDRLASLVLGNEGVTA